MTFMFLLRFQGEQLASIANKTSATEFDMGKTIEHLHAGVKIRRAPLKVSRLTMIRSHFYFSVCSML